MDNTKQEMCLLYEFIFGSAVSIFGRSVDYQGSPILQHNKEATSRSESVDLVQAPASETHAASHELPPTYGIVILSGDRPGQELPSGITHLSCEIEQNHPIFWHQVRLKTPVTVPAWLLVVCCSYSSSDSCVSERFNKTQSNKATKTVKQRSLTGMVHCFLFQLNVAIGKQTQEFF